MDAKQFAKALLGDDESGGDQAETRRKQLADAVKAALGGEGLACMMDPASQISKGKYPPRPCPKCQKIFAGIYCPHDGCDYREPEE